MLNFFKKTAFVIAVVGASVLSAGSSEVQANEVKAWKQAVVAKMREVHTYPRVAISQGIEGKAKVKINISADGTITNYELSQSTGSDVLDKEVPGFVERLSPLPALPGGKENLEITLPVSWSLG